MNNRQAGRERTLTAGDKKRRPSGLRCIFTHFAPIATIYECETELKAHTTMSACIPETFVRGACPALLWSRLLFSGKKMALFAWFNMTMHAAGLQIASLLLPIVPPSLMSVLSLSPPLRLVLCCFSFRDVFRSPREAGQGHKQEQSPPAAAGLLAAHTTPTTHSTNTTTTKDAYVDNTLEDRHTHGRNTLAPRPSSLLSRWSPSSVATPQFVVQHSERERAHASRRVGPRQRGGAKAKAYSNAQKFLAHSMQRQ
jgi:hypothetical protein